LFSFSFFFYPPLGVQRSYTPSLAHSAPMRWGRGGGGEDFLTLFLCLPTVFQSTGDEVECFTVQSTGMESCRAVD